MRRVGRENSTEFGLFPIEIELNQYDPNRYADTETDSGSESGTFNVTNNGDADAWPRLTFDPDANGDITLTNNTTGVVVTFDNAGAGSGLILDMMRWKHGRGDLLIAYRGSTNHYGDWQSPRDPFLLAPGTNSLTLNIGDSVQVEHRDAWL